MKYKVLSRLKKDGQVYNPCDEVEFEESDVVDLVEAGVLEPLGLEQEITEEETTEKTTEEEELNLGELTKGELQELAKEKGIRTSGLNKDELIAALEELEE